MSRTTGPRLTALAALRTLRSVPSASLPFLRARQPAASDEQIAEMRAAVRAGAADRPGIYRMVAEDGEVVYVGKSKRVRTRLLSYFRAEPAEKGARILRHARQIEWEYAPSEFAALLRELRLIKRHQPRFNVAMKRDERRYAFVRLTRGPAPKLEVVRGSPGARAGAFYGPFVRPAEVREAARTLGDALELRDCAETVPVAFDDQQVLLPLGPRTPGCLRYEVKKCLGPCIAACSARAYAERVALARAFLEGRSDDLLDHLRGEMEAASRALSFERAAAFRNRLLRLEALRGQFDRLRCAVEALSFVYTVPGHAADDRVYLIRGARVRAEAAAPRSAEEQGRLAALAQEVFGHAESARAPVAVHEIDEVLLLASWFRRFPAELDRARPPEALDAQA